MLRKLFYLLVAISLVSGFFPGALTNMSPPSALAEPPPNFNMTVLGSPVTVVKGQTAVIPIKVDFQSGFTTAGGINFQLLNGVTPVSAVFTPVPLKTPGGVALEIDTSTWPGGSTNLTVQASEASSSNVSANFTLNVITTSLIKFYGYDASFNKIYLTTDNTVTKQGQIQIYTEAYDQGGIPNYMIPVDLSSDAPNILGVYEENMGGQTLYALQNGTAHLEASSPDGTTANLTVIVDFPADPSITSISLTPAQITNLYTSNLTFWATGTRPIGWSIWGMLSDNLKDNTMDWSNGSMTYGGDFKINDANHPGVGTYRFGAFINDASNNKLAEAALPLTIINDPSYSALSGGVLSLDPAIPPYALEMFNLEFYQGGALQFSRHIFMHPGPGTPELEVDSIPPGTYRIRYVPGEPSIKPQWYPNAGNITAASDVIFTAGQVTGDIYFFALPGPEPPEVATDNATDITDNSAILNGTLVSRGSAPTANVSFQWGTGSGNLTFETEMLQMELTGGSFNATLTGLSANTTYYYRARAVGDGVSSGVEKSFTTNVTQQPPPPPPPRVPTSPSLTSTRNG